MSAGIEELTADSPAWLGHRTESYTVDLLDGAGQVIQGNLPQNGLQVDFDITRQAVASGGFTFLSPNPQWWSNRQVRIWYHLDEAVMPLATLVAETPTEQHTNPVVEVTANLFDRTTLLDEPYSQTYSKPIGTSVLDEVQNLITSATNTSFPIILGDLPAGNAGLLTAPYTRDAMTSNREIINGLLKAVGFVEIHTDAMGAWRSERYVNPRVQAPVWTFKDRKALYLPRFQRDTDWAKVPNRLIGTRKTSGSAPADRGVVTDEDPKSPFSYQSRGRWITGDVINDVDAVDFPSLLVELQRLLVEAQQVGGRLSLEHAVLPIRAGDVIEVQTRRFGLIRGQVERQSYAPKRLVSATIRGVTGPITEGV